MPGKVKVRILAGRNLPVMDRASDLTDAFVEVKFSNTTYKTDVARKSLNPQWNSEWYKFEVEDEDLQDEPLQIRVMDYDTYSAHDAIGKVYIDLDPLLSKDRPSVLNGWFPIYDTMHGIRGELNVIVKVDLFSDFNKFRQSSCGVNFFCTSGVPCGYKVMAIHGFVEELAVNDDPEYQWIDKIRSQRASNEARQILFSKLTGELQRRIGLKVLDLGGNAVIGYLQCFDLEGASGAVVRAIGTAVTVNKLNPITGLSLTPPHSGSPIRDSIVPEDSTVPSSPPPEGDKTFNLKNAVSPGKGEPTATRMRRSSESDIGTPPKVGHRRARTISESSSSSRGGSLGGSSGSGSGAKMLPKPMFQQQSIEFMEFPFFTIRSFPVGMIVHLGGVVSARSVKLLDRIHNPDEPETRDAWWNEIRTEIRSHAKAMGCHAVIGYSEQTSICDEIIVLSASGTAATVNLQPDPDQALRQNMFTLSLDRQQLLAEKEKDQKKLHVDVNLANQMARLRRISEGSDDGYDIYSRCSLCHIPYKPNSAPFPVNLIKCAICRRRHVPDVLFTTVEFPAEVPIIGKGCLIQSRICRTKKEAKGETNAKEISDNLPFMEYELHNQLLNKLKVRGMNMLSGLKIQVTVGERLLVAVATGSGAYVAPLPPPNIPKLVGKGDPSVSKTLIQEMQKKVADAVNRNKDAYNLFLTDYSIPEHSPRGNLTDESEDELSDLELSAGNKDTYVLELDDVDDAETISVLLDPPLPEGLDVCNTELVPGISNFACNLQMFTRVWRSPLNNPTSKSLSAMFDYLIKSLIFKVRSLQPCAMCHIDFDVGLRDEDQVQVAVTGMCIGLGEPPALHSAMTDSSAASQAAIKQGSDQEDTQFHMDGVVETPGTPKSVHRPPTPQHTPSKGSRPGSRIQRKVKYHSPVKVHQGIDITPLMYIAGGRIECYLGNLNFFIIRESTAIREEGGLNGFMHSFTMEVLAICRAHVAALGGNALVSFNLVKCVLDDNLHKNQSQCLINVCGDVVQVTYDLDQTDGISHKGRLSPLPQEHKRRSFEGSPSPHSHPQTVLAAAS